METAKSVVSKFLGYSQNDKEAEESNQEPVTSQTAETSESTSNPVSSENVSADQDTTTTTISSDNPTGIDSSSATTDKPNVIDLPEDKSTSKGSSASNPSEVQSPQQGPDPALVGDATAHPKLSGTGVDGSHSAVFGLTPDGHRHNDTRHGTAPVEPAHSKETTVGKKGSKGEVTEEDMKDAKAGN